MMSSSQNSAILVLIFLDSMGICTYTLLKVVSHYDFSVLFMSVTDFKNSRVGGLVGCIQFFMFGFFNFAKPLRANRNDTRLKLKPRAKEPQQEAITRFTPVWISGGRVSCIYFFSNSFPTLQSPQDETEIIPD